MALTDSRPVLPLSMVPPQQEAILVEVRGGQRVRKRLADLGLTPGATLRVVQSQGRGPMILVVRQDTRMALGRGMAHKILVTLKTPEPIP